MAYWSDRMKRYFQQKSSRFSTLASYQAVGKPLWTSSFFEPQVESSYKINPIVYRCISLIAKSLSGVPLVLTDGEKIIDRHFILSALEKPNPMQNYAMFCESVISYLLLSGNSYIEAVESELGSCFELYALRPDRIQIIPGKNGIPEGYEYAILGEKQQIFVDTQTGQSPILHLKLFNPLDDWYGLSPLHVAQQSVDLQNTVLSHNLSLLQNEGRPSGALIVKNNRRLNEQERQQLREDMNAFYAGARNSGRMMILEGDLDWREMGLSPKDMDFENGKNFSSRDICQIFGIPPICAGILGDATFSNYKEARQHLWDDTLLPMLDSFICHLNHWLAPYFEDPSLRLTYNKERIHAIAEKKWDLIHKAGCLTINEKRKILGYPEIEGGDVLK